MLEKAIANLIASLDNPVSTVLAIVVLMQVGAVVWLARKLDQERKYSHEYSQELRANTSVLQELSDFVKMLVLGRGD